MNELEITLKQIRDLAPDIFERLVENKFWDACFGIAFFGVFLALACWSLRWTFRKIRELDRNDDDIIGCYLIAAVLLIGLFCFSFQLFIDVRTALHPEAAVLQDLVNKAL